MSPTPFTFRIEIPAHDGHLRTPSTPPKNLTPSPEPKTPEDLARVCAERDAKNAYAPTTPRFIHLYPPLPTLPIDVPTSHRIQHVAA